MSELDKIPDLDVLEAKKELETRIHQILIKLPGLIRHRLQSTSLWNIAGCMNVTENTYDFGRLPVYYKKPFAPRPKRYDCLRALATFVIVKWWDYSLDKNKSPYPVAYLDQLDKIIELGLDAFKVVGAYEGGFRLVTCKKCEDTGTYQTIEDNGEFGKKKKEFDPVQHTCTCPLGEKIKEELGPPVIVGQEAEEEISMETATGETVEGIEEQLDADTEEQEVE